MVKKMMKKRSIRIGASAIVVLSLCAIFSPLCLATQPDIVIESTTGSRNHVYMTIRNNEMEEVKMVYWSIDVQGGIFKNIHHTSLGIIETLGGGCPYSMRSTAPIHGFGRVQITLTIGNDWFDETPFAEIHGEGFVLGNYVLFPGID
jgi:hypothetical protein